MRYPRFSFENLIIFNVGFLLKLAYARKRR